MKMNARKSNAFSYWKYIFYAPLLFGLLIFLNQPLELYGQSQSTPDIESSIAVANERTCMNLLRSVKSGDAGKVKELLKGVDPNCSDRSDGEPRSPLVAAARQGDLEIADLLLKANADVEFHGRGDETPLMAAAGRGHLEFVILLLDAGAEVDKTVKGDGTALIAAVRGNHLQITQLLLEKGADPYLAVPGDEYAMYHARTSGSTAMINLLNKYAAN